MIHKTIIYCPICEKSFMGREGINKYCSNDCAYEAQKVSARNRAQRIKAASPKEPNRICDHCGKQFVSNHGNQRFCSNECCKANEYKGSFDIFSRDSFRCIYCGRSPYTHDISLRVDHIFPVKMGGKDIAGNLVTSCESCNLSKASKTLPGDTMEEIREVVANRNKDVGWKQSQNIKILASCEKRRRSPRNKLVDR